MRLSLILFLSVAVYCPAVSQEVKNIVSAVRTDTVAHNDSHSGIPVTPTVSICPDESVLETIAPLPLSANDTLNLPRLNSCGLSSCSIWSGGFDGLYNWQLHEGLNISLNASVFTTFGKYIPHRAGFTQSVSTMYAVPLTSRMSFAVGGYFDNMYWANHSFRSAGLNAVFGYKFDEHWEGYIYGQKSIMNKRIPYPLYDINGLGDRIGAAVQYNFNPRFSVRLSVEGVKY